jgi:predicted dehydrogenase
MTSNELTVAVAGAGRWSERAHIPGWLRDSRVKVAALVDIDRGAAQALAEQFSIPLATDDIREVLDDPSIDVLDVATGNDAHFELSMAALEAGKHVLCEKPVHHDARETRRAADMAAAGGL